jgi:hypothetical protein
VLSTPPAFALSQDQTRQVKAMNLVLKLERVTALKLQSLGRAQGTR